MVFLFEQGGQMTWIVDLIGDSPGPSFEITLRVLALGCHFAIYLMHRRFFRAAQVSGAEATAGLGAGHRRAGAGERRKPGFHQLDSQASLRP